MKPQDREALVLDRAIDLMLAGGDVVHRFSGEIDGLRRAATAIIPSGRDDARAQMFATPIGTLRRRVRFVVVAAVAGVLSLSSVAVAARNATPGDALWSLRRSAQSTRIALSGGAAAKADASLARAAGDLALARSMVEAGRESKARDALDVFWRDLDAARSAIASLGASERPARETRAGALAADGVALTDLLDTRRSSGGEGSSSPEDATEDRSGSRSGEEDSGDPGSGSSGSGSDDTSGSGSDDTSGSGSDGTSGSGSDDSGDSLGSGSSGSGSSNLDDLGDD